MHPREGYLARKVTAAQVAAPVAVLAAAAAEEPGVVAAPTVAAAAAAAVAPAAATRRPAATEQAAYKAADTAEAEHKLYSLADWSPRRKSACLAGPISQRSSAQPNIPTRENTSCQ